MTLTLLGTGGPLPDPERHASAAVLVQCCYMAGAELTTWSFVRLAQDVIACADTAGKIARRARAKNLVLTHVRPTSEAVFQSIAGDVARDDDGPVVLGRDLTELLVQGGGARDVPTRRGHGRHPGVDRVRESDEEER